MQAINERIYADVVDTLKSVSTVSGYATDFVVEEADERGNSPRHGLAVVTFGDPIPQSNAPVGLDEYRLPVFLTIYAQQREASDAPVANLLARMAADARKALTQDLHRGGLAVNTIFPEPDQFETLLAPFRVGIEVHVQYRTLYNNPYER